MAAEFLRLEQRGAVAVLTLNRPETRNALSGQDMLAAFEKTFERLNKNLAIGAVVLTGAGAALCSGGNVPDDVGCWLLPRPVEASHAAELAFIGMSITAAQAHDIGLVSRVVPPDTLRDEALALATRIAAIPPQILHWTKRLLRDARTRTLDEALDAAARLQSKAHHTDEHAEAVQTTFDKRQPVFRKDAK